MPIDALIQRFRGPSREEVDALRVYHEQLGVLLERVRTIHRAWLEINKEPRERERLANVASVNRWEVLRVCDQLDAVAPARLAAAAHRDIQDALFDLARACQLLATGHRYHKSEALCDGQILLLEAMAAVDASERGIKLRLARP